MDTNRESEEIAFAKSILNIQDFTEIVPLYSENTPPAVVLKEVAGKSLKSKGMTAAYIGRFSKTDLSGFIGSANISDLSMASYSNTDSKWDGANMLFAGFIAPKKGDFGGILKIYADGGDIENLKDERYVGVNLRIDTSVFLPADQKIQLILTLEGDPGDSGTFGTSVSETAAGTVVPALSSVSSSKTLNIYEGIANITPNEDTTVYFDISQWDGRVNIKKIKLLVNPYSNSSAQTIHSASTAAQSITDSSSNLPGAAVSNVNADSPDSTGKNYDFKMYVYSIVSSHASKASVIQSFLTITAVIACLLAAAYAVLFIRARIIREKRRRERELLKKKRAQAAAQGRLPQGTNRAALPPVRPNNIGSHNRPANGENPTNPTNPTNMRDMGNIGYDGHSRGGQNSNPVQQNTNIPPKGSGNTSADLRSRNNPNSPNRNNNPFR